jgi:hypothetical protein
VRSACADPWRVPCVERNLKKFTIRCATFSNESTLSLHERPYSGHDWRLTPSVSRGQCARRVDVRRTAHHNARVIRRLVALVSIATLVTWSVLPQVHIHVGEGSDSHDPAEGIIHAHWSAHQDVDVHPTLRNGRGHRLLVDQQATVSAHSNSVAPAIVVVLRTLSVPPVVA